MAEIPFCEFDLDGARHRVLEWYPLVLYDKTSQLTPANEARKEMLHQKWKSMEAILPPAQKAELEHSKRAASQSGPSVTFHCIMDFSRGLRMDNEEREPILDFSVDDNADGIESL